MDKMRIERARAIALEVVTHDAGRKELHINQRTGCSSEDLKEASSLGISPQELKLFALQVLIPTALCNHFGEDIRVTFDFPKLSHTRLQEIALLALVHGGNLDMTPARLNDRIGKLSQRLNISIDELREFYFDFVLAEALKVMGRKPSTQEG